MTWVAAASARGAILGDMGGGNLFVVFGESDIALDRTRDGACVVRLRGVDTFDPATGEVRSSAKVEDDVAF